MVILKLFGTLYIWSNLKRRYLEAATRGVLRNKVFLEISQNSQKNTCARVSSGESSNYRSYQIQREKNNFYFITRQKLVVPKDL